MWVFGLLAGLCYVVPAASLPPQSEGYLSVDPLNVTVSANTWTGRENGQLFCGECGESQVSVMKIIGGRPASEGEYPWMVYLGVGCGGTLIKKQWVLTAAHCYAGVSNPKKYSIILGRTDYTQNTPGSLILKPIKVFIHRNYNPLNFKNDIALLKLPYALDFTDTIKPLCVARGMDLEFGVSAVATGWGVTQLGATNIPKRLREVTLDITSKAQCKKLASASPKFFICTLTKNKDACQGDSGGPLMVQGSSGKWTQVGIVSHGEGCALKNAPGVYTKVSAYTSWIKKKTRSSGC